MKQENIGEIIAAELKIKPFQTKAVIELLDDGNTIPFISRYRKEQTGELDEEKVRIISERLTYLRNFVKRQEEIISKIEEQGKMTDELLAAIEKTSKLQELEDIYLPYKQTILLLTHYLTFQGHSIPYSLKPYHQMILISRISK